MAADHGRTVGSTLDGKGQEDEDHATQRYPASTEAALLGDEVEDTLSAYPSRRRAASSGFLSRFNFLRSSSAESKAIASGSSTSTSASSSRVARKSGSTSTNDVPANTPHVQSSSLNVGRKNRSRRGSLRKTALLGGGKLRTSEKRIQPEAEEPPRSESSSAKATNGVDFLPVPPSPPDSDDHPTPRASYENDLASYSSSNISTFRKDAGVHDHSNTSEESLLLPNTLGRKPTIGDMSTTDEEEIAKYPSLLLAAPPFSSSFPSSGSILVPEKHAAGESFYPLHTHLQRRRSSHRPRAKSPLAAIPLEPVSMQSEEWDYSETEWWGWMILILTWAVFVMGMGSCFEVWSWAWDVGETPYAPPELEDDPTLPIVGYYPALIILTGVMAWVWVVVAWVGMKYFRHAKIVGDV